MRKERRPRITVAQIAEIRRRRAEGLRLKEIAETIGVSINTACRYGKLPARRSRSDGRTDCAATSDFFIAPPSLARLMAGR